MVSLSVIEQKITGVDRKRKQERCESEGCGDADTERRASCRVTKYALVRDLCSCSSLSSREEFLESFPLVLV